MEAVSESHLPGRPASNDHNRTSHQNVEIHYRPDSIVTLPSPYTTSHPDPYSLLTLSSFYPSALPLNQMCVWVRGGDLPPYDMGTDGSDSLVCGVVDALDACKEFWPLNPLYPRAVFIHRDWSMGPPDVYGRMGPGLGVHRVVFRVCVGVSVSVCVCWWFRPLGWYQRPPSVGHHIN